MHPGLAYPIFILIFVFYFASSSILRKKLKIRERKDWINKTEKKIVERVAVVSIGTLFILELIFKIKTMPFSILIVLGGLYGVRGLMLWRFDKVSKEYVISFLACFTVILLILFVLYLEMQLNLFSPIIL